MDESNYERLMSLKIKLASIREQTELVREDLKDYHPEEVKDDRTANE